MKRLMLAAAAMAVMQGCSFGGAVRFDLLQELRDSTRVQTNLPGAQRNAVIVACPMTSILAHCEVKKFDQWTPSCGQVVANLEPGTAAMVRFSGLFSDQRMTLQVRGVNMRGATVGTRSRVFYANDSSGNSGSQEVWEVSRSELEQSGR